MVGLPRRRLPPHLVVTARQRLAGLAPPAARRGDEALARDGLRDNGTPDAALDDEPRLEDVDDTAAEEVLEAEELLGAEELRAGESSSAPTDRGRWTTTAGPPGSRRSSRAVRGSSALQLSSPAVLGLALVAVLAAALAVSYLWRARPQPVPLERPTPVVASAALSAPTSAAGSGPGSGPPPASASARGAAPAGTSSAAAAAEVVVHVAGLVRRPGLQTLPAGARVGDAVRAAGGPDRRGDLAAVNLARTLVDGEQVLVLATGAAPQPAAGGAAPGAPGGPVAVGTPSRPGAAPPTAQVDLNAATAEQLQELPGVGPVLAQRILAWRQEHGRFSAVEELQEVSGIGDAKFADLAPRVRV